MSSAPVPAQARLSQVIGAIDRWQRAMSKLSPVRAHVFVMSLLFSAAVVVGYVLLPGDSERIAMLERDGKTGEARQILEAKFRNGDRGQRTLFLLQGLYEQAGDLPKTREMLELLAGLRPRDGQLLRQLGQFYKTTQAEPEYIRTLLVQIDLRYSEPACREVVGLLRRGGAYGEEQAALQKCRLKGYRRPEDMSRLASLLAVDGDIREASVLLRSVDDLRRLKSDRERLLLFDILLENDQPGEAQRRASRWIKASKDDTFALSLISSLVASNRFDAAIELARETSVPGDSIFLSIGEVMVERNQNTAAQAILRGWLDKAPTIEPSVVDRFIVAALAAGAPDLALIGAQKVGFANLQPVTAFELVRDLNESGLRIDAAAISAAVDLSTVAVNPERAEVRLPKPRARPDPAKSGAGLEGWKAALWKRLRDENKPAVAQISTGTRGVRAVLQQKELQALRLSRKARADRRLGQQRNKPGGAAGQPSPFNLFTSDP